jgi:hypothetical protein
MYCVKVTIIVNVEIVVSRHGMGQRKESKHANMPNKEMGMSEMKGRKASSNNVHCSWYRFPASNALNSFCNASTSCLEIIGSEVGIRKVALEVAVPEAGRSRAEVLYTCQ